MGQGTEWLTFGGGPSSHPLSDSNLGACRIMDESAAEMGGRSIFPPILVT